MIVNLKAKKFSMILTYLLALGPTQIQALGEPGGGGACCGVPDTLENDARRLQSQISEYELEKLQRLQFVEEICAQLNCGKLTEAQASRLFDHHLASTSSAREAQQTRLRWALDVFLAVLATAGAIMGYVGLRSNRKNKQH